ncbi:MAG: BatA domain-containing protein [Pseudomonadota bacterium]
MFSLGALGFLQPLFLAGLLALPLLWFLLRATPPAPTRIRFPGVRVLLGLADRERTPQRTPLWLLLLRMAAAALLLLAFAEPLVNPKARSAGSGPVLVILDGGWTSADSWSARVGAAQDALRQAAETGRPAALISLSSAEPPPERLNFGPAEEAMRRVEALEPAPWRPDPRRWIAAIEAEDALETVWIHDGLEAPTPPPEAAVSDDDAGALTAKAALAALLSERGSLTLIAAADPTRALAPPRIEGGALTATVLRAQGGAVETRRVAAFGGDPAAGGARRVGAAEVAFEADDLQAEGVFDLPVQLRNTLEKLQIDGLRHAGAVALLDDRFRRRRVALVSGEQERRGLPLLSGLHYLRAALAPHAAARETTLRAAMGLTEDPIEAAVFGAAAAAAPLAGWADAIVISEVGRIYPETEAALSAWVTEGGL